MGGNIRLQFLKYLNFTNCIISYFSATKQFKQNPASDEQSCEMNEIIPAIKFYKI